MPSANAESTPLDLELEFFEGRYATLGDHTVGFETHKQDYDPAELFAGLPDDRCQCPHWGVVTVGSIMFRFADRLETYRAGDAYYVPAGHLPLFVAGSAVVEFSPNAQLQQTMAVVGANLEAVMAES